MSERQLTEQIAGINPRCIGCPAVGLCAEILQEERDDLAAGVDYTMGKITEGQLMSALDGEDPLATVTDQLAQASGSSAEAHSVSIDTNERSVIALTQDCPGVRQPSFLKRLIGAKAECGLSRSGQALMIPASLIASSDPRVQKIRSDALTHIRKR